MKTIKGNLVDIHLRAIYPAKIKIDKGIIVSIEKCTGCKFKNYIIPGFVDSHVHIESSMLTPKEFSELVVPRGTVAVVTDPHEIANVKGVPGILFMLKNAKGAKCKMFFTIPSCVPATSMDGSGAVISFSDVEFLANTGKFVALSEVMDVFSVVNGDEKMMKKIECAKRSGLVIDGHAPLLNGDALQTYIDKGVSTDHETVVLNDAVEKIERGMKIQIRRGSAVDNFSTLKDLIKDYPDSLMFCTDDSHPDMLIKDGHIDRIVKDAVSCGYDIFDVLKIASLNPINHYSLPLGTLKVSDSADFQIVNNLKSFKTLSVYIGGKCVYDVDKPKAPDNDKAKIKTLPNKFKRVRLSLKELSKPVKCGKYTAIGIVPDQLITTPYQFIVDKEMVNFESRIDDDILKLVYINRYSSQSTPQILYVKGFGLRNGAIASTVAHDSHNILAVGTNDADLLSAINKVIEYKGGLSFSNKGRVSILPLPIAGIISDRGGDYVYKKFTSLKKSLRRNGSLLNDPFMTLSFLALIVIPEVKIGERGMFEFSKFSFVNDYSEN